MDTEETTWVTAFSAAMLISENDFKSSIRVADATDGAKRPLRVPLPQWGTVLIFTERTGRPAVKFDASVPPAILCRIIEDLW